MDIGQGLSVDEDASFWVADEDEYKLMTLGEIARGRNGRDVHSLRLSTGIFGKHRCPSGNKPYSPRSKSEVIVAVGDGGYRELIELGGRPCPVCKPHEEEDFWGTAGATVEAKYPALGIHSAEEMAAKLPFDARNLDWERILPLTGAAPNRLYVPKGLGDGELAALRKKFEGLGVGLPPVGYYDRDAPGHFREYSIPR